MMTLEVFVTCWIKQNIIPKQPITNTNNTASLFTNTPEIKARCGILFTTTINIKKQFISSTLHPNIAQKTKNKLYTNFLFY